MTPMVSFTQLLEDCELRIELAEESEAGVNRALAHGCGIAVGYYLAGGCSRPEYLCGCERLRNVAKQRIDMHVMRVGEPA